MNIAGLELWRREHRGSHMVEDQGWQEWEGE